MSFRLVMYIAIPLLAASLHAQSDQRPRYELYGGYSFLSNSLNGVSGSHQPLNGYEAAFAIPPWHDLRFKMSVFQYRGTNLGAPEQPYFVLAGGQYGRVFGREALFLDAMGGIGIVNAQWGANKAIGDTASFTSILGGGVDTPLSARFAFRIQGDLLYSYFKVAQSRNPGTGVPVYVPSLPNYFGRISTGLVWRF